MIASKPSSGPATESDTVKSSGAEAGAPRSRKPRRGLAPTLMVLPFVALFIAFVVLPIVLSVIQSFKSDLTGGFVGLKNYRYAIGLSDFWHGIIRVIYFGVIQVTIMIVLALLLALLLDSPRCRGRRIFATIYFLPFAVPGVIAAIMWGFLLSPQLDHLLNAPVTLGLSKHGFTPLGQRSVLYAIMLITLWEFVGYNMTLYLASLTSISAELSDAAHVDGASEWTIAFRIKVPLMRRMIALTVILSVLGSLQLFNEPQILSDLTAIGSSYTPNLLIYNTAFTFNNVPVAAAESTILALLIIVAAVTFVSITRRRAGRGRTKPAVSTKAGALVRRPV